MGQWGVGVGIWWNKDDEERYLIKCVVNYWRSIGGYFLSMCIELSVEAFCIK